MDESGENDVTCFYDHEMLVKSIEECHEWNEQNGESKTDEEQNR